MKYGQPIPGFSIPSINHCPVVPRVSHPEAHCTGCGRLSYVSGTGARINPLEDGRCVECRDGWPCVSCGSRHPLDELSDESLCGRCFVAAMARGEAA